MIPYYELNKLFQARLVFSLLPYFLALGEARGGRFPLPASTTGHFCGSEHIQHTELLIGARSNKARLLPHSLHLQSAVQALTN